MLQLLLQGERPCYCHKRFVEEEGGEEEESGGIGSVDDLVKFEGTRPYYVMTEGWIRKHR